MVEGDDLTDVLSAPELAARETGGTLSAQRHRYRRRQSLSRRAADRARRSTAAPTLSSPAASSIRRWRLALLLHAFQWRCDDWDRLAAGTLAGHLLECGAQITGGYFADPGVKDVPGLAEVGYPIAEIDADGAIVIGKPAAPAAVSTA